MAGRTTTAAEAGGFGVVEVPTPLATLADMLWQRVVSQHGATDDVQALLPKATVLGPQGQANWDVSGVQADQLLDVDRDQPLGEDAASALLTTSRG